MGDYISRDEPIFAIDGELLDSLSEGMAKEILEMLPAADVVERKTEKWIRGDAEKLTGSQRCSICHKACYKGNDYFNYCPNCGCKMEG